MATIEKRLSVLEQQIKPPSDKAPYAVVHLHDDGRRTDREGNTITPEEYDKLRINADLTIIVEHVNNWQAPGA
jgi:hypothetical protein